MANSFKNSYFYIGYIRRVFLSLLLCFSFGLTDEFNATLIENWQKANEILDTLKISKKQKEDILNSLELLDEEFNKKENSRDFLINALFLYLGNVELLSSEINILQIIWTKLNRRNF